ncbi:4Fe-4S dicluster domain-containing protein [Thermodesulfatator atlanticus]|uniref:4Fe-4S dicluster domain-containing protein n=1 Tax=Thermodesulfatator atlanticus TaxID=501497 RepID=UPI0003B6DB73|nr:4Fe-4S dicluster domain-containing protein [Thermodesulfatator atlanticus]
MPAILENLDFSRCLTCQTCGNGCPCGPIMDYLPFQIMRLIQLGDIDTAIKSQAIWICVGCNSCTYACPMKIEIPDVMDALREEALRRGVVAEKDIFEFHRQMLLALRRRGRVNELELSLAFKFKEKRWLQDFGLGMKMLAKRKIKIWPSGIKNPRELSPFFERCPL